MSYSSAKNKVAHLRTTITHKYYKKVDSETSI